MARSGSLKNRNNLTFSSFPISVLMFSVLKIANRKIQDSFSQLPHLHTSYLARAQATCCGSTPPRGAGRLGLSEHSLILEITGRRCG